MNTYQANTSSGREIPDALKSPRTLEEEADQVRHRIDERLDTLTSRLSPGELLDQALGMVREHGGEFGHNLCAQVTRHPVPFVLTGVGLSWLMLSSNANAGSRYDTVYEYGPHDDLGVRSRTGRTRETIDNMRDTASDAAEHVRDAASGAAEHVREAAGDMRERAEHAMDSASAGVRHMKEKLHGASHRMHDASGRVGYRARNAHEHMHDFFRDQPVLAGSLGMALGAALAALLPPTETEDRLMGKASDKAKSTARTVGGEQYERARDVARHAADTVRETVQQQQGGDDTNDKAQRGYPAGEAQSMNTDEAAGHPT